MIDVIQTGKWIARHRILILAIGIFLLLPSVWGMVHMRTNYDLLTYLPESIETVSGQQTIIDEYGMGAFSMIVVENKALKDVAELEADLEDLEHVKDVLWYDDAADISLPVEMLPADLREKFFHGDATMMLVLLDEGTSSDASMDTIAEIRGICDEDCYVGGMTAILSDLRDLADREVPIYVTIAVLLSLVVMQLLCDSFLVPFLFLADIGFAIIYNLGTNFMFGEISYITKAVAAVLQLGVTMDYSIFLLGSYREYKEKYPEDSERAMGHAIASTFRSVVGSSVTTIAGFIALCFMTFTLGLDMGIVMAKGVLFGVICCLTILPALILLFERAIEKTTHRPLLGDLQKLSDFITSHSRLWILLFVILFVPALWGQNHLEVYYDMAASLPESLPSKIAIRKTEEDFGSTTIHMILMDADLPAKDKKAMLDEISQVDGVTWCLGLNSLIGTNVPEEIIPENVKSMLQSGEHELAFISTGYYDGSEEVNAQIDEINAIMDRYDDGAVLIGEAPLTKNLMEITDVDFMHVNTISIGIIFVIILLLFRSISLPVLLETAIEFAIMVNLAIPYYMGTKLPFVASIILGTVQLGSTVDYAILMTTRYQKERQRGLDKADAVQIMHRTCMPSIITSGAAFFAATFGVAVYSEIDVIRSICLLLARGALISMVVVILVLPGMFLIFDWLICRTSADFLGRKKKKDRVEMIEERGEAS